MRQHYTPATFIGAIAVGMASNVAMAQHDHGHGQEHGEKAGHGHARVEGHGGAVTMTQEFHFETVFQADQVRLYLYDGEQNPMHVKHWKKGLVQATGEVQFRDRGRGSVSLKFVHATVGGFACPMCAGQESSKPGDCGKCGMSLVEQTMPDGTLWSCPMHADENGKGPGRCADCGMKLTPQDYLVAAADLGGIEAGAAKVTINLTNLPGSKEQTLKFTVKFPGTTAKTDDEDAGHGGHGDHGHDGHDH